MEDGELGDTSRTWSNVRGCSRQQVDDSRVRHEFVGRVHSVLSIVGFDGVRKGEKDIIPAPRIRADVDSFLYSLVEAPAAGDGNATIVNVM